jgi:hypothetical protein
MFEAAKEVVVDETTVSTAKIRSPTATGVTEIGTERTLTECTNVGKPVCRVQSAPVMAWGRPVGVVVACPALEGLAIEFVVADPIVAAHWVAPSVTAARMPIAKHRRRAWLSVCARLTDRKRLRPV